MGTINYLISSILQNIFFCVQHKKEMFIFGWTITLRDIGHNMKT